MSLTKNVALSASQLSGLTAFADAETEDETVTIELPEDLSTLSGADIESLRQDTISAFNALYQGGDVTLNSDEMAVLRDLKAVKLALDSEKGSRDAEAASLAAEMSDAPEAVEEAAEEVVAEADDEIVDAVEDLEAEVAEEAAEDVVEDVEAEVETEEVVAEVEDVEIEAEADADAEVVAEAEAVVEEAAAEVEAEVEDVVDEQPELITASAEPTPRKVSVPGIRSRQKTTEAPAVTTPRSAYRAAVNVPGVVPGTDLSVDEVASAFAELTDRAGRSQAVTAAVRSGQRFSQRHQVAQIVREHPDGSVVNGDDATDAIKFASDESRLPEGSLTASGGWCAPSETLYDLCQLESTDGILSVPSIMARRGGFRYTQGPDWADIFANTGFCFTEADDIAGDYDSSASGTQVKPTDVVPCPSFTDTRLDACGVTIQAGNLMMKAYPELVRRYVSGAVTAHFHRVATNVLADMITGSTAVTWALLTNQSGAASPVLSSIEAQVEDLKYRRRMSRNASIEVIMPYWARGVLRADLALRQGVDMLAVSDAQVDAWFRLRGVNVQYIYNFDNMGGASAATAWPTTLRYLIYPAGTWVKAESDLITIEMLHDSTLNENNNFTAIFTEEAYAVLQMCHDSRIVSVAVCGDGNTAIGTDISC